MWPCRHRSRRLEGRGLRLRRIKNGKAKEYKGTGDEVGQLQQLPRFHCELSES